MPYLSSFSGVHFKVPKLSTVCRIHLLVDKVLLLPDALFSAHEAIPNC